MGEKECDLKDGDKVQIKYGWCSAGRKGSVVGCPVFIEQWWIPILWDGEEDPDFHKDAGLILRPKEPKALWNYLAEEITNYTDTNEYYKCEAILFLKWFKKNFPAPNGFCDAREYVNEWIDKEIGRNHE